MQASRILQLNKKAFNGKAVTYVMSRDQRVKDNHALLAAQAAADEQKVPLFVVFVLKTLKNRSREHYQFMIDGLKEVAANLEKKAIPFVLLDGTGDDDALLHFLQKHAVGSVFFDFSPLVGARNRAKRIAKALDVAVNVVDTHNIIPAWVVSDKQEFAAHTMRRKVHKYLEHYIRDTEKIKKHQYPADHMPASIGFAKAQKLIEAIPAAGITIAQTPGEKAAHKHLQAFIETGLKSYALDRNDPSKAKLSNLSPYLHYGQIASLRVALEIIQATDIRPLLFEEARLITASEDASEIDGMNALLEEMVVRKELSDNYCLHNDRYLEIKGGPDWGQKTLNEHRDDPRDFVYSRAEWEAAKTHDESWNAAQKQLMKTGKMHGYMRMYWAKKMLEWSLTPEQALADCIYLNDKYSIDGGDPNGYVGMLWSMTGLHDRPWTQRSVFGQVRYMNEGGLKRKFDIKKYHQDWL